MTAKAAEAETLKIRLTNRGQDSETPWAEDLGPNPSGAGRIVRLINVPFLHAKPTWGDTLLVSDPTEDDLPTWDRDGVPFSRVHTRLYADGGRWAMIVDYVLAEGRADPRVSFVALARACAEHDIVCEGAWTPRDGSPGRVYLAVPDPLSDRDVMQHLRAAELPCTLLQVHPAPRKPQARAKAKPAARPRVRAARSKVKAKPRKSAKRSR